MYSISEALGLHPRKGNASLVRLLLRIFAVSCVRLDERRGFWLSFTGMRGMRFCQEEMSETKQSAWNMAAMSVEVSVDVYFYLYDLSATSGRVPRAPMCLLGAR